MISQSSRRESGSTPTVGSSSSSSSGDRTSVQASPSFCFMPPESRPASRSVNGPSAVISISRGYCSLPLGGGDAVHVGVEVQVLLDGQVLVQAEPLRHVADAGLDLLRVGGDVDAQHLQLAGVGRHQPGGQADERRLAGAVRPDQGRERAAAGLERDAVERLHDFARLAAERLADVAADAGPAGSSVTAIMVAGASADLPAPLVASARCTVAGMPSRSSSAGSFTNTRTS